MRIYLPKGRNGRKRSEQLGSLGFGQLVARGDMPSHIAPWIYDNGAFGDWKRGEDFDRAAFVADVERIEANNHQPRWLVVPDLVARGIESLQESLGWVGRLRRVAPLALAVQDGLTIADVEPTITAWSCLFVGGTVSWKLRTGPAWVELAHKHGLECHIGRCGTVRRIKWAREIGADSVDSSQLLWSKERIPNALKALEAPLMPALPGLREEVARRTLCPNCGAEQWCHMCGEMI